jgi:hypothetical protein
LDDSATEDGSSGGTTRTARGSNKWNQLKYKIIHLLLIIIYYCSPLVMMIAISTNDCKIASIIVGLGVFLSKIFVLDLFLYKMGNTQNWPKKVSEKKSISMQNEIFTLPGRLCIRF